MGMRGSSLKKEMPASAAPGRRGGGGNGGAIIAVGLLFIAFFIIVFITQITTNEAWIQGQNVVNVFQPNLWVFLQPFLLFYHPIFGATLGSVTPGAVIFGWGIETVYLGFSVVGFELIHNSVHQAGRVLGIIFEVLALVCVGINWGTDYVYGSLGSGDWGHFAFATMTAFVVGYFGNIGWFLIRYGYSKL